MSWILGAFGPGLEKTPRPALSEIAPDPHAVAESSGVHVRAGGLAATCHHSVSEAPRGGRGHADRRWIVVGTATRREGASSRLLNEASWRSRLEGLNPDLEGLSGHYTGLRWTEGAEKGTELLAFVDPLGIRSLFYVRVGPEEAASRTSDGSQLLVSTRPDWLARLLGRPAIDFSTFGAHWLFANQLSSECLLERIERLGPGERLRFDGRKLRLTGSPWLPEGGASRRNSRGEAGDADRGRGAAGEPGVPALVRGRPETRITRELGAGVRLASPGPGGVSLGLSGGLDSRVVLAAALGGGGPRTHTFGPAGSADVVIARSVAERVATGHRHLWAPMPDAAGCLAIAREHAVRTSAVSPASAALRLRFFEHLHAEGSTVIDGGFGEVARRGYYRRLVREAPGALQRKDAGRIAAHLVADRVDCFRAEVGRTMRAGARRELEDVLGALPEVPEVDAAGLADLLAVRTRLPNFFGREQARMDGVVRSVMPFARLELLDAVFRTPEDRRTGSRWVRRFVRRRARELTEIPLVRGDVTVPWGMGELPAHLWSRLKRSAGWTYPDPTRERFLSRIEAWARDAVRSRSVREYGPYDYARVRDLVEGYYRGDHGRARELDWWVAFECWRSELGAS